MKLSRSWLWLLVLIPLGLGVARLRFDADVLSLLPTKLGVAQGLKLFQRHFSDARELLITVETPTVEETESTARALAQLLRSHTNEVAAVMWQPAWMENPSQAMELLAFLWLNQPPSEFRQMAARLAITNLAQTLSDTRERLATSLSPADLGIGGYDPYGLTRLPVSEAGAVPSMGSGDELFVSRDGTFRAVYVQANLDLAGYLACRTWLGEIERIIAEARRAGQLPASAELHFTGRPAFVKEISSGMETDMGGSSASTLATIGILFWLTHRRLRPMFWLLTLLVAILGATLALSGLVFGTINVVSMGFASILVGLAEDFGIVIYQESRCHPDLEAPALRRAVMPGIFWSTVTTSGAFLTLNLSTLPGMGQLGSLVALGIVVAAVVMIFAYLPLILRLRRAGDRQPQQGATRERFLLFQPVKLLPPFATWCVTALLVVGCGLAVARGGLRLDRSPGALEPKHSDAKATLDRIKNHLGRGQEPLWVLVGGTDEAAVGRGFKQAETVLARAVSNQLISGFTLPVALWPQPEHQQANRAVAVEMLPHRRALHEAALGAGFTTNALVLTDNILACWQQAAATTNVFWPTNEVSRWMLGKLSARTTNGFLALGFVYPSTNAGAAKRFAAECSASLQRQGVMLSGWDLLGSTLFDMVLRELPRVVAPIFLLVVVSLWLAFRNVKDVVLSLIALAFSGLLLAGTMNLLGWEWNLMNVMALPLMLGMGVDFSIHILLAMRRYHGDRLAVRRSLGRALLLAGATTVSGFASLAFSSNAGISSLGAVCALGITLALLSAVYLLPVWWQGLEAMRFGKKEGP